MSTYRHDLAARSVRGTEALTTVFSAKTWGLLLGIDVAAVALVFAGVATSTTPLRAAGIGLFAASSVLAALFALRSKAKR